MIKLIWWKVFSWISCFTIPGSVSQQHLLNFSCLQLNTLAHSIMKSPPLGWRKKNLPRSTVRDKPSHFLGLACSVVERLRSVLDVVLIVDPPLVGSDDGGVRPVGGSPVHQVRLEDAPLILRNLSFSNLSTENTEFQTLQLIETFIGFQFRSNFVLFVFYLYWWLPVWRGHSSMYSIQIWSRGLEKSGL